MLPTTTAPIMQTSPLLTASPPASIPFLPGTLTNPITAESSASPQKDSASPLSQLNFLKNLSNDKKQTKGMSRLSILPMIVLTT
jgi:hypothetical protein